MEIDSVPVTFYPNFVNYTEKWNSPKSGVITNCNSFHSVLYYTGTTT
jgi:hypothetical protein